MTMVQWKSGCDYYLLSYEHSFLTIFPFKKGFEKVIFTATIGMPLQANGDDDVIESYLD